MLNSRRTKELEEVTRILEGLYGCLRKKPGLPVEESVEIHLSQEDLHYLADYGPIHPDELNYVFRSSENAEFGAGWTQNEFTQLLSRLPRVIKQGITESFQTSEPDKSVESHIARSRTEQQESPKIEAINRRKTLDLESRVLTYEGKPPIKLTLDENRFVQHYHDVRKNTGEEEILLNAAAVDVFGPSTNRVSPSRIFRTHPQVFHEIFQCAENGFYRFRNGVSFTNA